MAMIVMGDWSVKAFRIALQDGFYIDKTEDYAYALSG